MKVFKTLTAILAALIISFSVNAQASTAAKPASAQAAPAAKPAPAASSATAKPNGDARTKTGDKINKDLKGPNGETVYTGPKGGNYYLNKSGNKTYLKSAAASTTPAPAKK